MVKIKEAIVVEGRYDRNTLSQIVDATILKPMDLEFSKTRNRWHFCVPWRRSGG